MSSPFAGGNYGYPDRATVSSPGLGPRGEASQGPEDVSVRPMRRMIVQWLHEVENWKADNIQLRCSIPSMI